VEIKFVDLKRQYLKYKDDIDAQISDVLNSGIFILGPKVAQLEDALAQFTGAKYCISCSSGTDALLLSLMALDVGPGDEVITTCFTFVATAETIALLGAKPIFVDIDPKTYNMDVGLIEERITPKTKGIIAVSLYGQCPDLDRINEIASKYGLFVIEDAAQSFGATYKGRRSCSLTTIGITSFFPAKPFGCYGDGGAVFTSDENLADKIKALRNHGQKERYKHKFIGINGRLDSIQAAVLLAKLPYFEEEIKSRQKAADYYNEGLKDLVQIPYIEPHNTCVYAQYTLQVKPRDALKVFLQKRGIPIAIHYPMPLHLQECFSYLGYKKGDYPVAEEVSKRVISLPMHAFLKREEQDYIIEAVREFYEG